MQKTPLFTDLECLLLKRGFQRLPSEGNQMVYRHQEANSLLVFPPYAPNEAVRPHHLVATRTQLDALGLLTALEFNRWVEVSTLPLPSPA